MDNRNMRQISIAFLVLAASAFGQGGAPSDPVVASSYRLYSIAKDDIVRSAEKIPEDLWSFRPTPEVRTIGQLFAHIADGQYEFCGIATEGESVNKGIEKKAKTKAEIVAALNEGFAYCEKGYQGMTRASSLETVKAFGSQMTRISVMDFNAAHTMEHYGNLVTYMRIKGIVPPSSTPKK
jgi:uncharacterized damage-inducible protein DinB